MLLVTLDRVDVRLAGLDVLRGVSLELRAGESWALVGGNGAGKSTLLRLLRGEEQPTPQTRAGRRYHLDGAPSESPIGARDRIALVSPELQESYDRLEWSTSAEDAVRTGFGGGIWLDAPLAPEDEARVDEACALLGIAALRRRRVSSLSTGEMRRVLVARALVARPRLLLLDEPCDGLDAGARERVLEALSRVARSGRTLVVATHRAEEIVEGIARVAVMEEGRIVRAGGRDEALASLPLTPAPAGRGRGDVTPGAVPLSPGEGRWRGLRPLHRVGRGEREATPLLRIDHADVRLSGRPVLHDVSWTVRRGEHWAVTGPNGSGKSTLLRLAVGDEQAMPGGRVSRLDLGERACVWEVKARVGLVSPELQARFRHDIRAEEVVLSGLTASLGVDFDPDAGQLERAAAAMARAGAGGLAGKRIRALSYGEMRRLLLARALVHDPELLVLDEPMNGLDPGARAALLETLERLAAEGVTLVVATHHPAEIPPAASCEIALDGGRVAYRGPRR